MDAIRHKLDGTYHLTSDIDLTGIDWNPIGNDNANAFTGIFDGQGHVITGLGVMALNGINTVYSGLFGYASGNAVIQNVGLENACVLNITGNGYAGGLVGGTAGNAFISNCYVTGQVNCGTSSSSSSHAGGIVGSLTGTAPEVVNSYNAAKVTGFSGSLGSAYAGGIAGEIGAGRVCNSRNTGDITNTVLGNKVYAGGITGRLSGKIELISCANTGKISVYTITTGYGGGIAGQIYNSGCSIISSYSVGDVLLSASGSAPYLDAGGIVGQGSDGKVVDSYNRGNVAGNATDIKANIDNINSGGIVGNNVKTIVERSYSTGTVTGTHMGGVAGSVAGTAVLTNTFWNKESTQTVGSIILPEVTRKGVGSGTDTTVGLTAAEMKQQTSFSGFDFDTVWELVNGQNENYPVLREKVTGYAVTVAGGTGSSGGGTGSGFYTKGETVAITAPIPAYNYRFKEWTSSATGVVFADKTSTETTFVMPAQRVTVTAAYEQIPSHTLTVESGSGSGSKREGAEVSISAGSPATGKRFKEWTSDSKAVIFADKNSSKTTFIMPTGDVTVKAVYEDILYTITVNGGVTDMKTAALNTVVTITANVPEKGKVFKKWTTSSSGVTFDLSTSVKTTFAMPARNVTVTATYENMVKQSQKTPSAPTLKSKTDKSVTLNTIAGAEYRRGSGAWQSNPVFTGLSPNTSYSFYVRMKETDTHKASSASSSLSVRTDQAPGVINVVVNPRSVSVARGTTKQFKASVAVKNGAVKTVMWSVTGRKKSGTKISSSGKLTVAKNETAKTLKVKAVSKADRNKFAVATIKVTIPKTPALKASNVPKSRTVKKGAKIKLTAPKGTILYYTANNKKPTTKTKTKVKAGKSKRITLKKTTTLRVIAVKTGCTASKEVKRVYKVKK